MEASKSFFFSTSKTDAAQKKEKKRKASSELEKGSEEKKKKVNIVFNQKRARTLNKAKLEKGKSGNVLYWMSRDQRVEDNWALLYAQKMAMELECGLLVGFCLLAYPSANLRSYDFMVRGLKELEGESLAKKVPLVLKIGKAEEEIPKMVEENKVLLVVTDFSPLRHALQWKQEVSKKLEQVGVPLWEVCYFDENCFPPKSFPFNQIIFVTFHLHSNFFLQI